MLNQTLTIKNYTLSKPTTPVFQGISKADIAIAEQIVKEIRGYSLKSSTSICNRIDRLEEKGITVSTPIWDTLYKINDRIEFYRSVYFSNIPEQEAIISKLGNCGEMNTMTYQRLCNHFDKVGLIIFRISGNKPRQVHEHCFSVVGLEVHSPDFKTKNPHTWGKSAILVDPWADIVAPLQQGLEKQQDFIRLQNRVRLLNRPRLATSPEVQKYIGGSKYNENVSYDIEKYYMDPAKNSSGQIIF